MSFLNEVWPEWVQAGWPRENVNRHFAGHKFYEAGFRDPQLALLMARRVSPNVFIQDMDGLSLETSASKAFTSLTNTALMRELLQAILSQDEIARMLPYWEDKINNAIVWRLGGFSLDNQSVCEWDQCGWTNNISDFKRWAAEKYWQGKVGEAYEWFCSNWRDAAKAIEWHSLQYWQDKPKAAKNWCDLNLSSTEAILWDKEPCWAKSPCDALKWLKAGFSAKTAAEAKNYFWPEAATVWLIEAGWKDIQKAYKWFSTKYWRYSPQAALTWSEFLSPQDAGTWHSNLYWQDKPRDAALWRSCGWGSCYLQTLDTAAQWHPYWKDYPQEAKAWSIFDFKSPQEAFLWFRCGFSPEETQKFIAHGVSVDVAKPFKEKYPGDIFLNYWVETTWDQNTFWTTRRELALTWLKAGWQDGKDAAEWAAAGWTDPVAALNWYNFKTERDNEYWKRLGGKEALNWFQFNNPEWAKAWRDIDFWRDKPEPAYKWFIAMWKVDPRVILAWAQVPYWLNEPAKAFPWHKLGWDEAPSIAAYMDSGDFQAFDYSAFKIFNPYFSPVEVACPGAHKEWLYIMRDVPVNIAVAWYKSGNRQAYTAIYAMNGILPEAAAEWECKRSKELLLEDIKNPANAWFWYTKFKPEDRNLWVESPWKYRQEEAWRWYRNERFSAAEAWEWHFVEANPDKAVLWKERSKKTPQQAQEIKHHLRTGGYHLWDIGETVDSGIVRNCYVSDISFSLKLRSLVFYLETENGVQFMRVGGQNWPSANGWDYSI